MLFWKRDKKVFGEHASNRRRSERFTSNQHLTCPFGDLSDLSVSGMRVTCPGKPAVSLGGVLEFVIRSDQQQLRIMGRIVRLRRLGFKSFDMGVRFLAPTEAQIRALEMLGRFGFVAGSGSGGGSGGGNGGGGGSHRTKRGQAENSPQAATQVSATIPDFYKLLGVERDAAADELRQAYHALAQRFHPDHNADGDAARQFQLIHEAYTLLKDHARRDAYDALLQGATPIAPAVAE
ncbi:MAG: DnaJ domain-containing protein [Phycisphaeraceae bacterium]